MKPKLIFLDEPTSGLAPWPYLKFHERIYRGYTGIMESRVRDNGIEHGNYLRVGLGFRV